MTADVTPLPTLQDWWINAELPAKQFCKLDENGDLILKSFNRNSDRVLANLKLENAQALINALTEKFPEVAGRVEEVANEWNEANDKVKLLGKVNRLKEYLNHAIAIGNFEELFKYVENWELEINKRIEENFKQREVLVIRAEQLALTSDRWKEDTQSFKDFVEQWKQIGYVERHRNDQLWERLEKAKDQFYERKRQHFENAEKEMLQNLDLKIEIVEKAENQALSEDWKQTTDLFKNLMDEWRAIGFTWNDKNEELWARFIIAKNKFFERKNSHFETIKTEQEENYCRKLVLVEKVEALKESRDWNKTSQAITAIMEEWKGIGRVPLEKSNELWNRLQSAKDYFFTEKRQHQQNLRVTLDDNFARKRALAKRANELKDSNHWREVTEEFNELFVEWKKIGPVPREYGDTLWEEFIAAKKYFFKRKDEDRDKRKKFFEQKIKEKEARAKAFLSDLQNELKEEQEKLADLLIALENITPGLKEKELRAHLDKLIKSTQHKIEAKTQRIQELSKPKPDESESSSE
ncbi:MAG: DUF349 domain-containing protein [Bacteroidetes bacterium]|nr:DUF349 domain-containing protein [Bacteroidota bacterium]MBS1739606.1 DUF349 domain-containing protein [Bacteroidota bacterium]